eukprot:NODE_4444_length_787_cov_10.871212_g4285_i0.p1 GENE.NODE_4444_length_787_cov_10.871212_g4285_i0~~NODE_4444_length_787_cov_10.871212_g4285_i0.p1  ORF type:complete len:207 (+),score=49.04 NODE_4444_length_787_cov_10.871212_g4285_i0:150-770(+)
MDIERFEDSVMQQKNAEIEECKRRQEDRLMAASREEIQITEDKLNGELTEGQRTHLQRRLKEMQKNYGILVSLTKTHREERARQTQTTPLFLTTTSTAPVQRHRRPAETVIRSFKAKADQPTHVHHVHHVSYVSATGVPLSTPAPPQRKRSLAEISHPTTHSDAEEEEVDLLGGLCLPSTLYDRLFDFQQVSVKWLWELHRQEVGG